MEEKISSIFLYPASGFYWFISNNLNDSVQLTDIIPAIRTDHDQEFGGELDNEC